ncbi:MAG: hypothetical protein Q9193_000089 [Seirophora villosa]
MSESGAAAPSGPVSGAGGEPPKKPNDNGEKKGEKGKKPSYGRCAACGNYAHQGPCWRPCNLCGRRHNLRKACPRGAQQEYSGGFLANPPVIPPSPYGVGLGFGGAPAGYGTSQYQVMMGHLGAYVQSSLAVLGAGPGFAAAPGGFKAQVGGPGGKSIEAPAAEQPPTAAQSTSSDAKKKRKNRRQAKRQRREAQKAKEGEKKEGEKKEGAEGEMDLDDKATQQQLPERPKSPPGGPAEPVEKSQTS